MSAAVQSFTEALRDRYRVERELGSGGMATVYLAHDVRHDRPVALKVLKPDVAAAIGPARFLREVQVAAKLQHPHILPVFDSGAAAGQLWYTMPYVAGESLRDRLTREKQLPLEDALRLGREVAQALEYAHRHGVVHRDIKPENILLEEGEAMIADFGIAHATNQARSDRLTATGLTLGTPTYMSPEQAAGDHDIDGRSDLYSLGCVLYEMLAGEPPFTGPTPQAVMAKRWHDPVPSLQVVRETVPAGVDQAIAKALAKAPADRFSNAAELAQALSLSSRTHEEVRGEARRNRWIVPAVALALVATLGTVLVRSRPTVPTDLDSDLVAVAPFDVVAPDLQPWSEGLVDVLSRSLDAAGPLRTVAPTVALRRWTGRGDAASATALGRRTGAGLVIFGALDRTGADSIRIRAAWIEVGRGEAPREIEVRGDTLRMDRLVDSVAVALLRELGRTRPVGAVRQSPLGAKSLPALKAFLRAEQFYRRALWDSALVHYDRAIALDSTCALAYARVSYLLGWESSLAARYNPEEYGRRAAMLNHGLPPRDSVLILVGALTTAVLDSVEPHYFLNRQRLFATLTQAQHRYPGDPEIWYTLGEARHHIGEPAVVTMEETLAAFDRVIALDSSFAPAYFHTPGLAIDIDLGNADRARRYLAAYLRLNPRDDHTAALRLTARLLDSKQAGSVVTARLIDSAPSLALVIAATDHLIYWPDSAETAVRLLRTLARQHPSFVPPGMADSLALQRLLADALMQRGHLREAYQIYRTFAAEWPAWFRTPYFWLALYGAVPVDTATAVFHRALERGLPDDLGGEFLRILFWWYAQRDSSSLLRFALRVDSVAHRDAAKPVASAARHYAASAARAYVTLLRGDSAAALRGFTALPDSVCGVVTCSFQKLTEARLLQAVREDRRAAELLDQWEAQERLLLLEQARLAERLGDRKKALKAYRFVADIWRHADPELQPYVREAQSALARLAGEPPKM